MRRKNEVMCNDQAVCVIDEQLIDRLVAGLASAPRGRFRICLHRSTHEAVQEMVIACRTGSYSRPHRHPAAATSAAILRGRLRFFIFDDRGVITKSLVLGGGGNATRIVRLSEGVWHMAIAVSDVAVFHEVNTGPFRPESSNEWAPWSPLEDDSLAIREYLNRLTR